MQSTEKAGQTLLNILIGGALPPVAQFEATRIVDLVDDLLVCLIRNSLIAIDTATFKVRYKCGIAAYAITDSVYHPDSRLFFVADVDGNFRAVRLVDGYILDCPSGSYFDPPVREIVVAAGGDSVAFRAGDVWQSWTLGDVNVRDLPGAPDKSVPASAQWSKGIGLRLDGLFDETHTLTQAMSSRLSERWGNADVLWTFTSEALGASIAISPRVSDRAREFVWDARSLSSTYPQSGLHWIYFHDRNNSADEILEIGAPPIVTRAFTDADKKYLVTESDSNRWMLWNIQKKSFVLDFAAVKGVQPPLIALHSLPMNRS
jgi:hypothetical protein